MAVSYMLGICFLFLIGKGVSVTCPDGFEHHGGRCYKVFAFELMYADWAEAKVYCTVIGGDLAQIDDAGENAIVAAIAQKVNGSTQDVWFYIDESDMLVENEWRWMGQIGGSKRMTYTNWIPGQPDNSHDSEDCLALSNSYHGQWKDESCGSGRGGFICEANVEQGN